MAKRGNGEGSIYYDKKNDRWATAITIGNDPKTGRTVRRYAYGKTKTEVTKKKRLMLEKYSDTYYIDADRLKLGEWLNKFLITYKKGTVRENTYASYQYSAEKYIKPHLGHIALDKLLPLTIQKFVNNIADDTPRAAAYALTILRMAIRRAIEEGILKRDPTLGIKKPRIVKKPIAPIDTNQAEKLIAGTKNEKLKIGIKILYMTGIRAEELVALKWDKINFARRTIIINEIVMNTTPPQTDKPKSASSIRKITIPVKLADDLKNYKKHQAEQIIKAESYDNRNLIICRPCGEHMPPRFFCKAFKRIADRVGVTITPHGIRHTHATQLFAAGWHAKDVQERLGHSSIAITLDIYTHYVPSRSNEIADYLNQIYPKIL